MRIVPVKYTCDILHTQGSQEQGVKFQDQI